MATSRGTGLSSRPTLILFVGGLGHSPEEEMVAGAHLAIAADTLERALETEAFRGAIVVTDREEVKAALEGPAMVELAPAPFHFGQALQDIIRKYQVEKAFYIGGGALPLLPPAQLRALAQALALGQNTVITNNFFSSDMVAFTPGSVLANISLPSRDNPLARLLVEAGLEGRALSPEASAQFDVDTPTDLLILQQHPHAGPRTQAYLRSLELDPSRLRRAVQCFGDSQAQIIVAGRVGSHLWARLERETSCRVRLLAEERGLRADGREEAGEGKTILGFYLEEVGPERFFGTLAQLGDAAFLDSRVLFHHLRLHPTPRDRFLSDLGQPELIQDSLVRQFTRAAREAPLAVVLGGHSLVSGGLLALLEVASPRGAETPN